MKWLVPNLSREQVPSMIVITLLGGMVGGIYGFLHDLITWSISNEYFTRMKFDQFSHINLGFPPRFFAAQIGFVAVGAVGLAAGWFVARTVVPVWPARVALGEALCAFLLMILIAAAAAAVGYLIGLHPNVGGMLWGEMCASLGISDVPAFMQVALIHSAGYVGALTGLIVVIIHLRRASRPS